MLSVRTFPIYALILSERCTTCQCQLQLWNELPFSNTNIWDVESTENTGCEQHEARNDSDLAVSLKRFSKNTRIAYLNINSVAGFSSLN